MKLKPEDRVTVPYLFTAFTVLKPAATEDSFRTCIGEPAMVPRETPGTVLEISRGRALLQFEYPRRCYGWIDTKEVERAPALTKA